MAEVSIVGPDEGESLRLGPTTQMRIIEDGSTTGHRLGVSVSTLGPRSPVPPQHRHLRHDEAFYVVSGLLRFTVGHEDHDAVAGTLVVVPPGAPHTFANRTDEPVVLLTCFTPDLYVPYFRDIQDLAAAGPPSSEDVEAVMARYATEVSDQYAP